MNTGLIVIDIQNDYFPGGSYPLVGSEAAAHVGSGVLEAARAAALPVIHFQHIADSADATFFRPGTPGADIHPLVAPRDDERVLVKAAPNSFIGTGLEELLRGDDVDQLIVIGMMSSMCVDATVRAALDLGFSVTVVHDACAAPDLEFDGTSLPGHLVHAAFMAALGDAGARVVSEAELELAADSAGVAR
ncbi:cysteine hydrolase family protein [Leifsonia sp. A12D58]|uniref:cysteine hydrolase family protein n=1 Tax=Leifsonia sp. A12D58 TaxID=3397674 RepID=UPI0039E01758